MRLVRSVRDAIVLLQEQHLNGSLILLIAHEKIKNVNTFQITKIKLNDCERTVNNGLEMSATTLTELEQLMEMENE